MGSDKVQETSRRLAFRPDLQGLRALAIALVVLAHAGMPGVAGGFVGVDVFFVLSGYLITGLLLSERIATGRVRFVDFIVRRLRRLLPALLTMLVVVMPVAYLLLSDYEFTEQTASVAYAASWTSNLFFAFNRFDYFAELHHRDLFLHTWSLGVEEQFYLLWPLLALPGAAMIIGSAVLLGDSVGVHWYSLFPAIFRSPDWQVVVLTKSSCAWVDEDYAYFGADGRFQVCIDWREEVLGYLQSIRPDVVFVGNAPTYSFSDQQWVQGSRRLFERIAASATDVVVIAGTPKLSFDGPGCLQRRYAATGGTVSSADGACSESLEGKPAQRVLPLLARAADGLDNVALLDLNDLVCPDGLCSARRPGGAVVFRDERHLTDTFVRAQEAAFRRRVAQLGLQNLRNLDD